MKQSHKTGLVTGTIVCLFILGEHFVPAGNLIAVFHYGSTFAFLAGVYISIKRTRDRELNGDIDFKLGLGAGVICGSIAGIMIGIYQFIEWTHMDVYANVQEMRSNGVDKKDILIALGNLTRDNFFKAAILLTTTNIIIAFLTSIAASMMLKRRSAN
jgi:hypothetical protein